MKPEMVPLAPMIHAAQRSTIHLELRDWYSMPDEQADFTAWREAGRPTKRDIDPGADRWKSWLDLVRETVARGVEMRRLRVVSLPASDYVAFEYSGTDLIADAGERVRWLDRADAVDLLLPGADLWMFDEAAVRFGLFSGAGELLGHGVRTEAAIARQVAASFEQAWERAVPHAQFRI